MTRLRPPAGLRGRIVLAAVAALALIGAGTGVVLLAAVERDGRRAVDEELAQRAERVSGQGGPPRPGRALGGRFTGPAGLPPGGPGPLPGGPGAAGVLAGSGSFVQLAAGDRVVARGDVPAELPRLPAADGFATVELAGTPWRTLTLTPGGGPARLQLAETLAPVEARVGRVRRLVAGTGLGALGLVALATWWLTSAALRPLGRLRAGAERVTGLPDLAAPLPAEGPEEVRSLAAALNAMLGRVQASSEATRRFAADAGHELRTPLAALRANLEALERNPALPSAERERLVAAALADGERMVRLLSGLQALTRGEAAEALPREEIDVADLAEAAAFGARARHPGTDWVLDVDDDEAVSVVGWPDGLRLIVDNLLDNAARHGGPGGRVRVVVGRGGDRVRLEVDDDGPGIPAGEREEVLAPFRRGAHASGPGSGLGLAIVAQQVALHGGELRLADGPRGGLIVAVRLPAAVSPGRPEPASTPRAGAGARPGARPRPPGPPPT